MAHFSKDYIDFFTELAFNNEKSWFDVNRKRYEQSVREPFKAFTMEVIKGVQEFDPTIGDLEPKHVMFRINRDLRFSKDKTPYNTWLSAAIVGGGKKNGDSHPGYYFRFAVDNVHLGGGIYSPSRERLLDIRRAIAKDPAKLHRILNKKKFRSTWGELTGDENKIMPKEFKELATTEPHLKKKGFSYWSEHPEQEVLREDLLEWVLANLKQGAELNEYLRSA